MFLSIVCLGLKFYFLFKITIWIFFFLPLMLNVITSLKLGRDLTNSLKSALLSDFLTYATKTFLLIFLSPMLAHLYSSKKQSNMEIEVFRILKLNPKVTLKT